MVASAISVIFAGGNMGPWPRRRERHACRIANPALAKGLPIAVDFTPAHPSPKGSTMHYKRISADCHLDMPCMPPELFVENASRDMKERMPYVEEGPDGPQWVAKNGYHGDKEPAF
jgi:hypothetical protein